MKIEHLLIIPDYENIEASLRLAKQYGCGFEYNDFFNPDLLDQEKQLRDVMHCYQTLPERPAYCTSHGAFLDITVFSDDARIRQVSDERVEQSLQIAAELGVEGVIFHTNYMPNLRLDSYRDSWVESNRSYWLEKAVRYPKLNIYMENMFDMDWTLLARLGEAMQETANFGICLDYAHAYAFGREEEIGDWVRELAPYIRHIHINDNDLRSDLHLPLGEGKIDWRRFRQYYEEYFPDSSVLIEVKGIENIERSLEYLRQL
jgi:sugar phosphate isomerase/epimerase